MFDFLPFGRKKNIDPLSDLKAVTLWLKELPRGDIYAASESIVQALARLNERDELLTPERLRVLMCIDDGAQDLQKALWQQYLHNPRMSKAVEGRLWSLVFSFCREMSRGYHAFIMDFIANPGRSKIAQDIPLITARAVHYLALEIKWRYFHYEPVGGSMWRHLHNLYHLAEYEEFDRRQMALFGGGDGQTTSCADEYLRVLLLDTLNTGNLSPKQIDMVDRWLLKLTHDITLERQYDPEKHVFYVHLGEGRGAHRLRRHTSDEMCRYWSTHVLTAHFERIKQALADGEPPARLGLTDDCRMPACLEFVAYVAVLWSPAGAKRVRRAYERYPVSKVIEVVHGISDICANVRQDNERAAKAAEAAGQEKLSYDEMLDVRQFGFVTQRTQLKQERVEKKVVQATGRREQHERWVMQNESEGGCGAFINEVGDDWVKLGRLVGLKTDANGNWVAGVIRRLSTVAANRHYVGIELLCKTPVAVMLRALQRPDSGYSINGIDAVDVILPVSAILVQVDASSDALESLIVQSVDYATGRKVELITRNKTCIIRLGRVMERGDDWLRVGFEVTPQEGAGGKS